MPALMHMLDDIEHQHLPLLAATRGTATTSAGSSRLILHEDLTVSCVRGRYAREPVVGGPGTRRR